MFNMFLKTVIHFFVMNRTAFIWAFIHVWPVFFDQLNKRINILRKTNQILIWRDTFYTTLHKKKKSCWKLTRFMAINNLPLYSARAERYGRTPSPHRKPPVHEKPSDSTGWSHAEGPAVSAGEQSRFQRTAWKICLSHCYRKHKTTTLQSSPLQYELIGLSTDGFHKTNE